MSISFNQHQLLSLTKGREDHIGIAQLREGKLFGKNIYVGNKSISFDKLVKFISEGVEKHNLSAEDKAKIFLKLKVWAQKNELATKKQLKGINNKIDHYVDEQFQENRVMKVMDRTLTKLGFGKAQKKEISESLKKSSLAHKKEYCVALLAVDRSIEGKKKDFAKTIPYTMLKAFLLGGTKREDYNEVYKKLRASSTNITGKSVAKGAVTVAAAAGAVTACVWAGVQLGKAVDARGGPVAILKGLQAGATKLGKNASEYFTRPAAK